MQNRILYDVEHGNFIGVEHETKQSAIEAAQEWFAEKCAGEARKNGEEFTGVAYVVGFDDGDAVSREEIKLHYQHYHGDHAEHNTLWGA
jgi:hypothetical protein